MFAKGTGQYIHLQIPTTSIRVTGILWILELSDRAALGIGEEGGGLNYGETAEVLCAISSRTTSWIEDEAIWIGIILDQKPEELYQVALSKRMELLVRKWTAVPRTLFFVSGPRLDKPELPWMPRTGLTNNECFLLSRGGNTQLTKMGASRATRTEQGLILQALCVFIRYGEIQKAGAGRPDAHLLFLHNDNGDCYAVTKSITPAHQRGPDELSDTIQCAVILEDIPTSRMV